MIPIETLKLTPRRVKLLKDIGIHDVESLLRHYPLRYEMVQTIPFSQWQKGDHVAFEGLISSAPKVIPLNGKRSMTIFKVMSWNEEITVKLFNNPWISNFTYGKLISIFGVYQGSKNVTINRFNFTPIEKQLGLRPVYPLSKAIKPHDMQAIMDKALPYASKLPQLIPDRFIKKYKLLTKKQAIEQIHRPVSEKALRQALRTLKYEEFLCFQCVLQKQGYEPVPKEPKVFDRNLVEEKVKQLPFTLTSDQRKALDEILDDLLSDRVMYRMLQGDVGCGKTIIAALALYATSLSGAQAVLMAPTEILARQHLQSLENLGLEAVFLSGSLPAAKKREVLEQIKEGKASIIVGTHALFQEKVEFNNLGLIVADEQQRFGVKQRRALIQKGIQPDFLMMSATPIPRTYAHFVFGDISLSSIHTLPPGRIPAHTTYIAGSSMKPFLKDFLKMVKEGRQAYVVCASIEENSEMNLKAAENIYESMNRVLKGKVRMGLLHGKMSNEKKDEIMQAFKNHEIDCLVSTTVIEVGIDVSNATLMVIYDAHRFGLSTLHQLRGRITRGKEKGYCWLLSSSKDEQAAARLKKLEELSDGFSISEFDLQTRGPGDILGTRQSGLPSFLLGDFQKDPQIMEVCIEDAKDILKRKTDREMLEYLEQASLNSFYMD